MPRIRDLIDLIDLMNDRPPAGDIDKVRDVLKGQADIKLEFYVDVPDERNNNHPRRMSANLVEYDPDNDAVKLQAGSNNKVWKNVYTLVYKLKDARVFEKNHHINVIYTMKGSGKPLFYKKEANPNFKAANPLGAKKRGPRPDPFADVPSNI